MQFSEGTKIQHLDSQRQRQSIGSSLTYSSGLYLQSPGHRQGREGSEVGRHGRENPEVGISPMSLDGSLAMLASVM